MHPILLVTTTTGTVDQWADAPTTVALVYALAGAFFLAIYALRRLRQSPIKGNTFNLVRLPI